MWPQVKCFKYWPSEGVLLAHSLGVIQQDEQIFTGYTIRTFTVTLKDNVSLCSVWCTVLTGLWLLVEV